MTESIELMPLFRGLFEMDDRSQINASMKLSLNIYHYTVRNCASSFKYLRQGQPIMGY